MDVQILSCLLELSLYPTMKEVNFASINMFMSVFLTNKYAYFVDSPLTKLQYFTSLLVVVG